MALITSATDGVWSDPNTWIGGDVPGWDDNVIVNHQVILDQDVTFGTIFSSDVALYVYSTPISTGRFLVPSTPATTRTINIHGSISCHGPAGLPGTVQIGNSFEDPIPDDSRVDITFLGSTAINEVGNGWLKIYGCPAYHMADTNSIRTRLVEDPVNIGGPLYNITVADNVDWEIGDYIFLCTGGDPDHAPTANEYISITNKISANQYTVSPTSNHFGSLTNGDVVIHASRNVTMGGQPGLGFSWSNYDTPTASYYDGNFDINWCQFLFGGRAPGTDVKENMFCLMPSSTDTSKCPPNSGIENFRFTNNIARESADTDNYGIHWGVWSTTQTDVTRFTENHFYGFSGAIKFISSGTTGGIFWSGPLSSIESHSFGVYGDPYTIFNLNNYFYVSDSSSSTNTRCGIYTYTIQPENINNIKIHRAYNGIQFQDAKGLSIIQDGEIFNCYNAGMYLNGHSTICRNIEFRNHRFYGVLLLPRTSTAGKVIFDTCSFDACNTANLNVGGLYDGNDGTRRQPDIILDRCTFGTKSRNYQKNFGLASSGVRSPGRTIFDHCTFVQPLNFSASGTLYWYIPGEYGIPVGALNRWFLWGVYPSTESWSTGRCTRASEATIEIIACEFKDAGGTDYWASMYPNTDRVGLVAGGGEIHKVYRVYEPDGYIDGTYARKLLPFNPTCRTHITKSYSLTIPVEEQDTITISLSLKKNISQTEYRRPKIHVFGCGIDDEAQMSDVVDSWEKLTVSGTSICAGTVEFWISCWAVNDPYVVTSPPTRQPNTAYYSWAYPIDPGGTGSGAGTPDNLILYADGLEVNIS